MQSAARRKETPLPAPGNARRIAARARSRHRTTVTRQYPHRCRSRLRSGMKGVLRQGHAIELKGLKKRWPQARGTEFATWDTGFGAQQFEDLLHQHDAAVDPGDLAYAGHTALAVGKPMQLHHHLDRRSNLRPDAVLGHRKAGHANHLFQTQYCVARAVGMDRGHGPFVTGGHRLQHVEGFFAAHLTDDDAIGPHAQCIFNELALADLAAPLDIRWAGLQTPNMWLLQLQLGGVLDRDQTLLFGNEARKSIEERRLAGARATGNENRYPR